MLSELPVMSCNYIEDTVILKIRSSISKRAKLFALPNKQKKKKSKKQHRERRKNLMLKSISQLLNVRRTNFRITLSWISLQEFFYAHQKYLFLVSFRTTLSKSRLIIPTICQCSKMPKLFLSVPASMLPYTY